eukprot:5111573-Lingulodinium_polyedra.AAC.1
MGLFGADVASLPERELRGLNSALADLLSGTHLPMRSPAVAAIIAAGGTPVDVEAEALVLSI